MKAKIKKPRKTARSLTPQEVTENNWYYEQKGHLLFVHQVRDKDGAFVQTDQVKIPWRKIEASLKRVNAEKRRAAKRYQARARPHDHSHPTHRVSGALR